MIFSRFRRKPIQYTFVYCPGCKLDLVSRVDVDGTSMADTDLVRYLCGNCFTVSVWNFDIAPAPILIRSFELSFLIITKSWIFRRPRFLI